MGDVRKLRKSEIEYVDILAKKTNEVLKPLGINGKTALQSFRHMQIWLLVFDELREQLGYPVQPMINMLKEDENDGG